MSAEVRYAVEDGRDPLESLVLRDHQTNARVVLAPTRGGLVTRFSIGGEELLYLDEATLRDPSKNVRGGIPLLFPIAGKLAPEARLAGDVTHAMKQHGFARNRAFSVASRQASEDARVTLALESDEATLAQYPFAFRFLATFSLKDGALGVRFEFVNTGNRPMPIQPGVHPYFVVPDEKKRDARVPTDAKSAFDNVTGRDVELARPIDLTAAEVDLHLHGHTGDEVRLVRPWTRDVVIRYSADHHMVVVWTQRGKDFVCVEPWLDRGGALASGGGVVVAPGASHVSTLEVSLA